LLNGTPTLVVAALSAVTLSSTMINGEDVAQSAAFGAGGTGDGGLQTHTIDVFCPRRLRRPQRSTPTTTVFLNY
jgi:hypothetical protein